MAYFDDIAFDEAGIEPQRAPARSGSASHYALIFASAGQMHFAADGSPRTMLDAPFAFWESPNHVYEYGPGASGPWHHYWIRFHGPRGVRIVEQGLAPLADAGYVRVRRPRVIAESFARLVVLVQEHDVRLHPEAVVALEGLVALLWRDWWGGEVGHRRVEIERVAAEVRNDPYRAFDFGEAAERLHISYGHFHRLFRRYMGRPPHDYLLVSRMRKAAGELLDRQRAISTIAANAGYEDPSQFSKLFKKKIGMSPQGFRDYGARL